MQECCENSEGSDRQIRDHSNRCRTKLKYFVRFKIFSTLRRGFCEIKKEGGGGESICKPGSVEDSHSSTMAITGHL